MVYKPFSPKQLPMRPSSIVAMHSFDLELTSQDIQALHDPDSVAAFLTNLGYDRGVAKSPRARRWRIGKLNQRSRPSRLFHPKPVPRLFLSEKKRAALPFFHEASSTPHADAPRLCMYHLYVQHSGCGVGERRLRSVWQRIRL